MDHLEERRGSIRSRMMDYLDERRGSTRSRAMDYLDERRGSTRSRVLERSSSYSEAIGNDSSRRSSIQIPRLIDSDVYTNEELKKHYRISQTYVEGREISFPTISYVDTKETLPSSGDGLVTDASRFSSSEDDNHYTGLRMTIDVDTDTPKSDAKQFSEASTRPIVSSSVPTYESNDIYEMIEVADSVFEDRDTTVPSTYGHTTTFTKRKKKGTRHRRVHGRPTRSRRVVHKNGEENVPIRSNIPSKSIKYMRDVVNTVINSKWRFIILMMIVAHFIFWLVFAGIWYAVSMSYAEEIGDGKAHCVNGTSSFAGMLMMSVETQMTIGYGVRFPNEECPEAIIVMVIEIVAGTALSGGLSSLLFTKLVRPNRHVSSVGFSKKATVCLRDGELVLQFRVWDFLNLNLVGSNITAYMLKPIRTLEGEFVQNYMHQLKLKQATAFLLWPITVVHVINAESPLYDLSAQDMLDYRFEIVICLNGSSRNMGTVTQSRTSYLSKEIIWGYRFKNVLHYSKTDEAYIIDTENLNSVEQVETPLCSASCLKEFKEDIKSSRNNSLTNVSLSQEGSISKVEESLPSSNTSSFNRNGTQKSFGWAFQRFHPERYIHTIQEQSQ